MFMGPYVTGYEAVVGSFDQGNKTVSSTKVFGVLTNYKIIIIQ
jgi:hypothetical protein